MNGRNVRVGQITAFRIMIGSLMQIQMFSLFLAVSVDFVALGVPAVNDIAEASPLLAD